MRNPFPYKTLSIVLSKEWEKAINKQKVQLLWLNLQIITTRKEYITRELVCQPFFEKLRLYEARVVWYTIRKDKER